VIFQNIDDKKQLSKLTRLSLDNSTVIQGSGVNLSLYKVLPPPNGLPIVLLAARLLVDMVGAHMVGMVKIQKNHKNVIINSKGSKKADFVFNNYKELAMLIQS
jgi:UDP-N-acetylenolpyruvoylglucosamine reductase